MPLPVTYLFVPGDRPERFDRALGSGADVVILDLEDAVHADKKAEARAGIAELVPSHARCEQTDTGSDQRATTPGLQMTLRCFVSCTVSARWCRRQKTRTVLTDVLAALGEEPVLVPLIESALGLARIDIIAGTVGVQRLAFGTLDFALGPRPQRGSSAR